MRFEVSIVYKGQNNYIIDIPDEELSDDIEKNKEIAEGKAVALFDAGDNGVPTGSEWETVENIASNVIN